MTLAAAAAAEAEADEDEDEEEATMHLTSLLGHSTVFSSPLLRRMTTDWRLPDSEWK
jgi:hypothetical protein